jgi:NADH-quinone oxidoreductase subunit E
VLTDEERRELENALTHYPSRRSAAITALKIVQRHRGWLSDEALSDLGGFLGVSADELDTLATFYNLLYRKPVGRHVILVCDSMVCWALGHERLVRALEDELDVDLGGTTGDGRFTLLPIVCLGACDQAPAMLVDDDLHGPVQPEDVAGILEAYP